MRSLTLQDVVDANYLENEKAQCVEICQKLQSGLVGVPEHWLEDVSRRLHLLVSLSAHYQQEQFQNFIEGISLPVRYGFDFGIYTDFCQIRTLLYRNKLHDFLLELIFPSETSLLTFLRNPEYEPIPDWEYYIIGDYAADSHKSDQVIGSRFTEDLIVYPRDRKSFKEIHDLVIRYIQSLGYTVSHLEDYSILADKTDQSIAVTMSVANITGGIRISPEHNPGLTWSINPSPIDIETFVSK